MVPADEIEGNLESIEHVPRRILPEGAARDALLALTQRGEDVYVYASGGEELGTWCVWIEALARVRRPECNGRVALTEWVTSWHELVAEAGLTVEVR